MSFHTRVQACTPELVAAAHGEGALVLLWSPMGTDEAAAIRQALALGVDGFFANDPALLARIVKAEDRGKPL
jgi:glycerophosphoryl diester phosphodiesterase